MALLANHANRRWFIDEVLAAREGEKLVDIGCGPGDILDRLPRVTYVGCDISEAYIQAARRRFGGRGVFIAGRPCEWLLDARTHGADVVLAHGVLHHVDDKELKDILEFAHAVLDPGGRFVFYEPCRLIWQSPLSRFFMSLDRGQHIRLEQEWKDRVGDVFGNVRTNVVTGINRLGYIGIAGVCHKRASR
jgi:SAM-dependent methyltransferase